MTLVITELSILGVAMVADTAVTIEDRPYIGFQKLFKVPLINAGLSIWGDDLADIRPDVDADIWLQDFIDNHVTKDMSLWNMAEKLAKKLNDTIGKRFIKENKRMGIHVAGFDIKNGLRGPALYHVHNGHYQVGYGNGEIITIPNESPPIREFRAHDDCNPKIYNKGEYTKRRNGDFAVYAYLNVDFKTIFENLQKETNFIFPYPSTLEIRGEYLRFWVNTVKDIFRLSNLGIYRLSRRPPPMIDYTHIGGPVTVLTISEQGIKDYYTI
nr:MAG: hypothetical protein OI716_00660 [Candidatus Methanoperedens sp.]WAI00059.1 MAG: hypothetical protein OI720_00505 [Candidatus Methanoperedens sp.]